MRIDHREYRPRALCSYLRIRLGAVVTLREVCKLCGPWPEGQIAIERLVRASLARKVGVMRYELARTVRPDGKKKRRFRYPVAIAYLPDQPVREAMATHVPRVGGITWLRTGGREEKAKYVGRVSGGWRVMPL